MNIKAELTANVWKILVSQGDKVSQGQELAVLESMKMEIPVESPTAGTVASVHTAEGDAVSEGQLLFVVEE